MAITELPDFALAFSKHRPINEEDTRALLRGAVEQSETLYPGDVNRLDELLDVVNRR